MKNILALSILCIFIVAIAGCEKDEPLSPAQMIEGKWTITSQELLTTVIPGDGSFLQFNACSSACSGVDYKASDTTSGSFTYVLNIEGTTLTIDDQSSDGGAWSATWDILELSETRFRMTATTIVGNLKVEMSK